VGRHAERLEAPLDGLEGRLVNDGRPRRGHDRAALAAPGAGVRLADIGRVTLPLVSTAVLAGLVGALAGLIVALIAQSREDKRLRQAEEWRQRTAKQERLRKEFETALQLVYAIEVNTSMWQPMPTPAKRLKELDRLYEEAKLADTRLKLEGATQAWSSMQEVARHHQIYSDALRQRETPHLTPESYVAATDTLKSSHEAISAVAASLHVTLAAELDKLTPPGPPQGLRSWLASGWRWLRT
jgi:gas vesicle protein